MLKVLFRKDLATEEEYEICKKFLPTVMQRTDTEEGHLILGRYSVLPYYEELEKDLINKKCLLVNSFKEHSYVANFEYYEDIKDYTPKTYFYGHWHEMPEDRYVVKGKTNSRKFEWATKMFAESKKEAIKIALDLMNDFMLKDQGIIIRKFENLKNVGYSINGMPFANEHRFFFLGETLLSHGFYWSIAEKEGEINQDGIDFAKKIAKIISKKVNFFVLDIAEKIDGSWILIEVNDGQMSGLSNNNPETLYKNLSNAFPQSILRKN